MSLTLTESYLESHTRTLKRSLWARNLSQIRVSAKQEVRRGLRTSLPLILPNLAPLMSRELSESLHSFTESIQ